MAMNGSNFLVLANTGTEETPVYEAVGCQRDATVDEATATIDVSCKDSRAQRVLAGRYSGSISLDSLYIPDDDAYLALKAANRNGTLVLLAREENGDVTEVMTVKIDSMSETFPDQGEATIAVAMTFDGFPEAGS